MPFFFDQIFWGKRVAALGAGPPPIGRRDLTVPALLEAIKAARSDGQIISRANALGEAIRSENGVAHAVRAFESHLETL